VITFYLVAFSSSTQARIHRSRKPPKMVCTTRENAFQRRRITNELITSNTADNILSREGRSYESDNQINFESSFWLRNACHNGFVVIKEPKQPKRVLAQHEGINQHDKEVELIKESCIDEDADFYDQIKIKTRLYSPSADRYICFTKKGKIRPMRRTRAERLGNLCAFYENIVPDSTMTVNGEQSDAAHYVTFQSAYNKKWYLGFGPNPLKKNRKKRMKNSHFHRGVVYTRDGNKATFTRKMVSNPKKNRNLPALVKTDRCDFRFHTGRYTPHNVEKEWKGLYEHVSQNIDDNQADNIPDQKGKITKTANQISTDVYDSRNIKSKYRKKPYASKFKKSKSKHHKTNNKALKEANDNSFYKSKPTPQPHEQLSAQRLNSKIVSMEDEVTLSNGVVISSPASMENFKEQNETNAFDHKSILLNNDINNTSLINQERNSQNTSKHIDSNAFFLTNTPYSSSGSKKIFNSSPTRNKKISNTNKSYATPLFTNNDSGLNISTVDHVPISQEKTNIPEIKDSSLHSVSKNSHLEENLSMPLSIKPQSMIRRQKLLRRIDSLKRPKSAKNSKIFTTQFKKQFKDGSKYKSRLRQRRLRLKYLRQHERPVNSYLYMHNIPRKLKRRIPRQKATISPQTGIEVNGN